MPVASTQQPAAFSGTTVLVDNPVQQEQIITPVSQPSVTKEEKG